MFLTIFLTLCAIVLLGLVAWATVAVLGCFAFAVIILSVSALPAYAATLDTFLTAAAPGLLELIGVVIAAIIAWATKLARDKWNIDIDARYREGLQSALMTGARLALARQLTGSAAIQIILDHVRDVGAPDAVRHFDLDAGALTNLAEAKLEQAVTEKMKDMAGPSVNVVLDAIQHRLQRGS